MGCGRRGFRHDPVAGLVGSKVPRPPIGSCQPEGKCPASVDTPACFQALSTYRGRWIECLARRSALGESSYIWRFSGEPSPLERFALVICFRATLIA